MSRLAAIDFVFLLVENQVRPMHMSSCLVFEPPRGEGKSFLPRLLKAFREADPGAPFNQKLQWLDGGLARWETVRPDPYYHVRHVAIPGPGTRAQLDDTLALLNAPLLDRAYPLWQCFVIEGLEHDGFALFFKLHHSLIDGEGGIKLMRAALSDNPRNKKIQPVWESNGEPPRKPHVPVSRSQLQRINAQVNALPAGMKDIASGLLELGAQALGLKPQQASLPFRAPATPFNTHLASSARCYANCEIPLDRVKAMARASGSTVNDVALAFIDDALHKYLAETGAAADAPLVASMPLSTRVEGQAASGNQVIADLVPLGAPDADIIERLRQIHECTGKVKDRARKMSAPMRQTYILLLLGLTTVPELVPGINASPSANVLISNMAGPAEQLYLGGAPLRAMLGLPILPPSPCLNITFVSIMGKICLGVASTPEAMSKPARYVELLLESFAELERKLPQSRAPKKAAVKKKQARGRGR
ncbi:MAG: wax ester/triacylglycerol synthase family O-acyltransferase [Pseudomonadales bacterium]|nr:wax ester/triacylglycerol synthase family O-acyltransferase [Pseudomonadales bacterium]